MLSMLFVFSRPYKLAIPMDEAVELLRAQAGTIYDPDLIRLFVGHVNELEQAAVKESKAWRNHLSENILKRQPGIVSCR